MEMVSGTHWLKLNDEDLYIKADNKTTKKPYQIEVDTMNLDTMNIRKIYVY